MSETTKEQRDAILAETCSLVATHPHYAKILDVVSALCRHIDALEAAIKKHHDQKADDRCHLDDNELYAAAGLGPADTTIKDPVAMLENCKRFIRCRMTPGGQWVSYAELESANAELRHEMATYFADVRTISVERAMKLDVCSICFEPRSNPFFHGDEYAHISCVTRRDAVISNCARKPPEPKDEWREAIKRSMSGWDELIADLTADRILAALAPLREKLEERAGVKQMLDGQLSKTTIDVVEQWKRTEQRAEAAEAKLRTLLDVMGTFSYATSET